MRLPLAGPFGLGSAPASPSQGTASAAMPVGSWVCAQLEILRSGPLALSSRQLTGIKEVNSGQLRLGGLFASVFLTPILKPIFHQIRLDENFD